MARVNRIKSMLLTTAVGVALLVPAWGQRAPSVAQPPAVQVKGSGRPHGRELVGSASCSASACHGGGEIGRRRSEATAFAALDPHTRAFDSLLTRQAQGIAKHLWNDRIQAHEAPLCLKCHVHPQYDRARPNFRKQDGVGCESCHGPAQDWLTPHYRANRSQVDLRVLGFADTKDLVVRANICATCHVGTAEASVDHDLIAAGHPALRFEFATYLANLPPHWDVDKDRHRSGGKLFEMRAWALGQLITSASAFELLAHRADPASGKAWPEFAEFDCFSCHHDLQPKSGRQSKSRLGARKAGSLAWSEWYHAMPEAMRAAKTGVHPDRPLAKDFRPRVDRLTLVAESRATANGLRAFAANPPDGANAYWFTMTATLAAAHQADINGNASIHWEHMTQRYLAFLALRQANWNLDKKNVDLDRLITQMRGDLTFPPGVHAPPVRFVPPPPKIEVKK